MARSFADIAFTEGVRAFQARMGSRDQYAALDGVEAHGVELGDREAEFIAARDGFYQATVGETGWPYVQHRGGPRGFLKMVDDRTLAFADYRGNRQYISSGNLAENPKAHLFLMDYAHRQRIKIWGAARVVEGDTALTAQLMPKDYQARAEQVIVFTVKAWDANCPQHIPVRLEAKDVQRALDVRDARILELEREVTLLRTHTA